MLSLIHFLLLATAQLGWAATTSKKNLPCTTIALTISGAKNTSYIATETNYRVTRSSAYTTYPVMTSTLFSTSKRVTVTSTSYWTVYTTKASVTKTIPTSSGFKPFASVDAFVSPIPAITYGYKTVCTTTVSGGTTSYSYDSWPPDRTTSVKTVTWTDTVRRTATKTVTITTPTATVFAACYDKNNSNIGTQWKGKTVNEWHADEQLWPGMLESAPRELLARAAEQSPVDCCNAAFALHNISQYDAGEDVAGFVFRGPLGISQGSCSFIATKDYHGFHQSSNFLTGEPGSDEYRLGAVLNYHTYPDKVPVWKYKGECKAPNWDCSAWDGPQ